MASELRVDTLKDSSGNNSVGMSYVSNGSAKATSTYDQQAATIKDSFNMSSITDNATADFTLNFTNSFSNLFYSNSGGGAYALSSETTGNSALGYRHKTPTTGSVAMLACYGSSGSALDWERNETLQLGDLA